MMPKKAGKTPPRQTNVMSVQRYPKGDSPVPTEPFKEEPSSALPFATQRIMGPRQVDSLFMTNPTPSAIELLARLAVVEIPNHRIGFVSEWLIRNTDDPEVIEDFYALFALSTERKMAKATMLNAKKVTLAKLRVKNKAEVQAPPEEVQEAEDEVKDMMDLMHAAIDEEEPLASPEGGYEPEEED